MATKKIKGWVPKDESGKLTIRFMWEHDEWWPHKTLEEASKYETLEFKQVEITITCKDVAKEKK